MCVCRRPHSGAHDRYSGHASGLWIIKYVCVPPATFRALLTDTRATLRASGVLHAAGHIQGPSGGLATRRVFGLGGLGGRALGRALGGLGGLGGRASVASVDAPYSDAPSVASVASVDAPSDTPSVASVASVDAPYGRALGGLGGRALLGRALGGLGGLALGLALGRAHGRSVVSVGRSWRGRCPPHDEGRTSTRSAGGEAYPWKI